MCATTLAALPETRNGRRPLSRQFWRSLLLLVLRLGLALLAAGPAAMPHPVAAATQPNEPPRTLRLDYFHTGGPGIEVFAVDRVVIEPLPWPGNSARPIDDTNLGKYFFEVVDRATNRVLYSRGFASIFGEWEETDEAKTLTRTFSESVRFPMPPHPVRVVLSKRDEANDFRQVWSTVIDPGSREVDPSAPPPPAPLLALQRSGDPATKVDLLILGDGYTREESGKFERDARRLMEMLFQTSPFREHRGDFNVWGLCPPAAQSGISRPSTGVHVRSPLATTYDAFGAERYVLTFDNRAFRDIAAFAPYEFVEILVNGNTYGGGGIFNLFSTVAADSVWSPYVFIHELGHHFAGLADEYYTSDVPTVPGRQPAEPWEPNVTNDPQVAKWRDLVGPGTPLPTPWSKDAFEAYSADIQKRRRAIRRERRPEAEMDALFREEREHETRLLQSGPFAGKVGAFEGADYRAHGAYRPQSDCTMFTRDEVGFCAVCRRAIERVIDLYTAGPR